MASLIATVSGDWNQTVCISCYGAQVVAERDMEKAKQPSTPITPRPSKKIRTGQLQNKPPRPIPKKLRHRLPGIDGFARILPCRSCARGTWTQWALVD
jgi:hypothetical protein